jgi:hypothetical protein
VLSWNEMPAHQHSGVTDPRGGHDHGFVAMRFGGGANVQGGFTGAVQEQNLRTDYVGDHQHNMTTDAAGSSWSHNNVQPTVAMLVIIKALHWGF